MEYTLLPKQPVHLNTTNIKQKFRIKKFILLVYVKSLFYICPSINNTMAKTSIQRVWERIFSDNGLPQDNKYVVAFGNSEWGEQYDTKEEFISAYRDLLYRCWFQDMSVYYNGKLIRSVLNYNAGILGKYCVERLGPAVWRKAEYKKY